MQLKQGSTSAPVMNARKVKQRERLLGYLLAPKPRISIQLSRFLLTEGKMA